MTDTSDNHLYDKLRKLGTSSIGGILDALKIDGLMPLLKPIAASKPFAGPAFTVKADVGSRDTYAPAGFNIASYVDAAAPGDVIIIDAGGAPVSLMGGIAVLVAQARGIAGIAVHGGVRDGDEIAQTRFPVHARHVVPVSGRTRIHVQGIQTPIEIDGCGINPGDVLVGDGSGIICIPREHATSVVAMGEKVLRRDELARAAVLAGANFKDAFAAADRQIQNEQ